MSDKLLFTPQFHTMYTFLGVVSLMYIAGDEKGVQRQQVMSGFGDKEIPRVENAFLLLAGAGIIREDGNSLIHLQKKFYRATMWDLLTLCLPHMNKIGAEDDFRQFMRSEKVWVNLVDNIDTPDNHTSRTVLQGRLGATSWLPLR